MRPLSPRQAQVREHILQGHTTAQIAQALGLSKATVKNHITKLLRKCGVVSRAGVMVQELQARSPRRS